MAFHLFRDNSNELSRVKQMTLNLTTDVPQMPDSQLAVLPRILDRHEVSRELLVTTQISVIFHSLCFCIVIFRGL